MSTKTELVLQWIPAHCGIPGNEKADELAKAGGNLLQTHPSQSFKEIKTLLKQSMKMKWSRKNGGYKPELDNINSLSRNEQTKIFRLRTGHCGLRAHLHKMGLRDTAACSCGALKQTPEHILQDCPDFARQRREVWPTGATLDDKLWGTGEDLKRTVLFVTHTGLDA